MEGFAHDSGDAQHIRGSSVAQKLHPPVELQIVATLLLRLFPQFPVCSRGIAATLPKGPYRTPSCTPAGVILALSQVLGTLKPCRAPGVQKKFWTTPKTSSRGVSGVAFTWVQVLR